uniref:SFRICE_016580 n=1 Tax=Spodoptera frugiperda TaxID=7108 RepID=A0A2H1X3C5_SPOFR
MIIFFSRILSARSADEFYSCMGGGAGAVWEAGDSLVARVVAFGSAPELPRLRSLHRYRVAPPAPPTSAPIYHPPLHSAMQSMTKRGLRLFYSEDEGDSSDDGNKMALATFVPRREDRLAAGDRLSLDIGALKRQYARLRERQRQAHVILAAACARHAAVGVPTSPTSLTVNNLLLGKSALVSSRGRRLGPPPGAIPPSRQTSTHDKSEQRSRQSSDTISWNEEKSRKTLSRRNSVKWKDIKKDKVKQKERKASIDLDEAGDGIIVSEIEANRMIANVRSRSSSETSSYSSHSASSTDTSLCDENERGSDSEPDIPDDEKDKNNLNTKYKNISSPPTAKPSKSSHSLTKKEPVVLRTPDREATMLLDDKPIKNISEYLDSAAGEPLRTYIDGFESKLNDSLKITNDVPVFNPTSISPCSPRMTSERNEVLQRLNRTKYEENSTSREITRPTSFTKSPNVFTELSPIDLSPCNCGVGPKSPYEYDFEKNFKRPPLTEPVSRPPDIIDSFTMYPNFVPDIDLSDKNVSDFESPPGSPGSESIIVSEDEPPIPLKIDKYFEHSPEFFGARVTDPNSSDIPNRRSTKRLSRLPKKPDSLTLQSNHNDKLIKEEAERASSLPQSHSFAKKISEEYKEPDFIAAQKRETPETSKEERDIFSPKDYILQTGRKNSERALQIIQENSKILSRILTKQNMAEVKSPTKYQVTKSDENVLEKQRNSYSKTVPEKTVESQLIESPLLKESTSDSLIGYRKRSVNVGSTENNDFVRIRPISIDDPFSLEIRNSTTREEEFSIKHTKSPSSECLGNKTDLYGWENKGFLAKCDHKSFLEKTENFDFDYQRKASDLSSYGDLSNKDLKPATTSDWTRHSFSGESKASVTLPSSEPKDTSTYEKRFTSDDYNYPFSSKYNDFVLSKASDICSKTVNQGPKVCENVSKTDNSQVSDFAHVVTSSISFTYEPSAEDDSPTGAKSNSSDTLCQITSLDQVSTPISPKIFPNRETPTIPKDYTEKSDRTKVESDDTCSAITSLIETDTLSSLSYPRSPSTGSYHPFPTRPVLRMPKELGVRLGMYPKDVINSPPK